MEDDPVVTALESLALRIEALEPKPKVSTPGTIVQVPQWVMVALLGTFLAVQIAIGSWMIDLNGTVREMNVTLNDIVDERIDRQGERITENHDAIADLQRDLEEHIRSERTP